MYGLNKWVVIVRLINSTRGMVDFIENGNSLLIEKMSFDETIVSKIYFMHERN